MKLNESIIICYISVRIVCTTNANVKKAFKGHDGFCKCICDHWTEHRE